MKKLMMFLALFIVAGLSVASEIDKLFVEGSKLYEAGDFQGAGEKYKTIIDYGFENPYVYYNLGNTYLKTGKLGFAILNYEKAYKLDSKDEDILANLNFARLQVVDKAPETEAFRSIINKISSMTGKSFDRTVFLVLFWLFCCTPPLCYFLRGMKKRIAVYASIFLFSSALLAGSVTIWKSHRSNNLRYAVVTVQRLDVHSGPGDTNPVLFRVHEGLKVRVLNERNGWRLISLNEKMNGWVPAGEIGMI